MIKAWDVGIASMRKNEVAVFTCKPDYAYGETGAGPRIPPNATLVFEVELFSWRGEQNLTLKVLVATIDAQWEGMGDVGSARYELALLPPIPDHKGLTYRNL